MNVELFPVTLAPNLSSSSPNLFPLHSGKKSKDTEDGTLADEAESLEQVSESLMDEIR